MIRMRRTMMAVQPYKQCWRWQWRLWWRWRWGWRWRRCWRWHLLLQDSTMLLTPLKNNEFQVQCIHLLIRLRSHCCHAFVLFIKGHSLIKTPAYSQCNLEMRNTTFCRKTKTKEIISNNNWNTPKVTTTNQFSYLPYQQSLLAYNKQVRRKNKKTFF